MLVDTHCHLDHPSLLSRLDAVLASAGQSNVMKIIVPGVDSDGWDRIASLGSNKKGIFTAFGLHPMATSAFREELLETLSAYLAEGVALGEIGLDYTFADQPREKQMEAFRLQLRLAVSLGKPLLIHCRKAFQDLLRIMKEENVQRVGGVMHAFSGSMETARECIKLGLCISISGTVTYRNAVRPVELAAGLPLEHLVLETDSPDMTPEPYRGRDNEPAFLREIVRRVAEIRGVDVEKLARITTQNAERMFAL